MGACSSTEGLPPGSTNLLTESLAFGQGATPFADDRFRKHGPIWKTNVMSIGETVMLVGPEAQEAFASDDLTTRAGAMPPHMAKLLYGDSVAFLDGAAHRHRRECIDAMFDDAGLDMYHGIVGEVVDSFFARWQKMRDIDMRDELRDLTVAIFAAVYIGDVDLGDHDASDPPTGNRVEAVETDRDRNLAQLRRWIDDLLAGFASVPIDPGCFPTTYSRALEARDKIRDRALLAIRQHRAAPANDGLQRLIDARNSGGDALDDTAIAHEILHLLFASVGGVHGLLCNTVAWLDRHPDVMATARDEAAAAAAAATTLPLGRPELADCRYLNQVINEAVRFFPIIHWSFAITTSDITTSSGFTIPKGWTVAAMLVKSCHNEKAFDNANAFVVDRFPDTKSALANANYLAQGMGPHQCAGVEMLRIVMRLFFHRFVGHKIAFSPKNKYALTTDNPRLPKRLYVDHMQAV